LKEERLTYHPISGRKAPEGSYFDNKGICRKEIKTPEPPEDLFDPIDISKMNKSQRMSVMFTDLNVLLDLYSEKDTYVTDLFEEALKNNYLDHEKVTSYIMNEDYKEKKEKPEYGYKSIDDIIIEIVSFSYYEGDGKGNKLKKVISILEQKRPQFKLKLIPNKSYMKILSDVICYDLVGKQGIWEFRSKFIVSRGTLFYLDCFQVPEIRLICGKDNKISPEFKSFIRNRYNLINVNKVLEFILDFAWSNHSKEDIQKLFYFNKKEMILYVHDGDKYVYKLDGSTIETIYNGEEVLFYSEGERRIRILEGSELLPHEDIDLLGVIHETNLKHWDILFNRTNFCYKTALSIKEQMAQLLFHIYSIPFGNKMRSKPILIFIGEAGSGKTFTSNQIGRFFCGPNYSVRTITKKDEENFIIAG
jgi:hypothetical protein